VARAVLVRPDLCHPAHPPGRCAAPRSRLWNSGPIQLLISDLTVSAGETFAEALLARTPAPTRIGTANQGVFSDDMRRRLPNGWRFTLGNEAYFAPDGHNYEGAGIPPSIPTPVFSPTDLNQRHDTALETALDIP
jgi:C-terminal processing protease CtpA/Prc